MTKWSPSSPEVQILRILKDVPDSERFDVLATVCAAFVQTNGTISAEAKRNSRDTVLGPLKRKPCNGCGFYHQSPAESNPPEIPDSSDRKTRQALSAKRASGLMGRK